MSDNSLKRRGIEFSDADWYALKKEAEQLGINHRGALLRLWVHERKLNQKWPMPEDAADTDDTAELAAEDPAA